MSDYETYVKEINNVYAILEKIKNSWNDTDNLDFVEEFLDYRKDVLEVAKIIKNNPQTEQKEVS